MKAWSFGAVQLNPADSEIHLPLMSTVQESRRSQVVSKGDWGILEDNMIFE